MSVSFGFLQNSPRSTYVPCLFRLIQTSKQATKTLKMQKHQTPSVNECSFMFSFGAPQRIWGSEKKRGLPKFPESQGNYRMFPNLILPRSFWYQLHVWIRLDGSYGQRMRVDSPLSSPGRGRPTSVQSHPGTLVAQLPRNALIRNHFEILQEIASI